MVYTARLPAAAAAATRSNTSCGDCTGPKELPTRPSHHLRQGRTVPTDPEELAAAQPGQPSTIDQLQALLDVFVDIYNHRRPHRSLPHRATPATIYARPPKATPGSRDPDTHDRVRHDRSTTPALSPCASAAGCTTSASAEPTPEPTSSCSSTTSTFGSSTPPPANSCANSSSTPAATTSPPAHPKDPPETRNYNSRTQSWVQLSPMS